MRSVFLRYGIIANLISPDRSCRVFYGRMGIEYRSQLGELAAIHRHEQRKLVSGDSRRLMNRIRAQVRQQLR